MSESIEEQIEKAIKTTHEFWIKTRVDGVSASMAEPGYGHYISIPLLKILDHMDRGC